VGFEPTVAINHTRFRVVGSVGQCRLKPRNCSLAGERTAPLA
jgi:hypothetical protein